MARNYLQLLILELLRDMGNVEKSKLPDLVIKRISKTDPEKLEDRKVKPKYVITRAIRHMAQKGSVIVTTTYIKISKEGEEYLYKLKNHTDLIDTKNKSKQIIITNFSEDERWKRDNIRRIFKNIGLEQIKPGVWITEYNCKKLVDHLKQDLNLSDENIQVFKIK